MYNCFSKYYIKGTFSTQELSIQNIAASIGSFFENIKEYFPQIKELKLLMNDDNLSLCFNINNMLEFAKDETLANAILKRYRSELDLYYSNEDISTSLIISSGYNLYFFTESLNLREQFGFHFRIGSEEFGIINFVDITFPFDFNMNYNWHTSLLLAMNKVFSFKDLGVYPQFTLRLKDKSKFVVGWVMHSISLSPFFHTCKWLIEDTINNKIILFSLTKEDFDIANPIHIEYWKKLNLELDEWYKLQEQN